VAVWLTGWLFLLGWLTDILSGLTGLPNCWLPGCLGLLGGLIVGWLYWLDLWAGLLSGWLEGC